MTSAHELATAIRNHGHEAQANGTVLHVGSWRGTPRADGRLDWDMHYETIPATVKATRDWLGY